MNRDFVEVGVYKTLMEAKVAQGLLEVNGIKSFILGEEENKVVPDSFTNIYAVSLKVLREDYLAAKNLLGKNKA